MKPVLHQKNKGWIRMITQRVYIRRAVSAIIAFLLIVLLPLPAAKAEGEVLLHCFSLGKADSFAIVTGEGTVLIDCGESGQGDIILEWLKQQGIDRIDTLIITHFDKDHVGGAAKVLKKIPVSRVLQSNSPKDSKEYRKYLSALALAGLEAETVREELSFTLGDAAFTVYPPERESYAKDPSNNSSLVTAMRHGECSFLFTGDAESARLQELVEEKLGQFDFLQVPHHGVWQTQLISLLNMVQPEAAVITSSEKEPEDQATVSLLEKYAGQILLTREGEVDILSDGSSLSVCQEIFAAAA